MKKDHIIWKSLATISQMGIAMMVPILIGLFIGIKLDGWLSTNCWFFIFLMAGILAAFRNAYLFTKSFYAKDLEKELKKQKYFDDLKKDSEPK